jgi:hypothetical protein
LADKEIRIFDMTWAAKIETSVISILAAPDLASPIARSEHHEKDHVLHARAASPNSSSSHAFFTLHRTCQPDRTER